jgi:Predicted acyltransferases
MKSSADFNRNNLDCLRLILASTVALFHISALSELSGLSFLGVYCSPHFAVRSFFVISGLLIYRSYQNSSSAWSYFDKRIRRIYPAYFTTIVLSAVALVFLSTVPFSHYFGFGFWKYLIANLLFLNFLAPSLPGVFTANNISAVNGALWTLKIEVVFYLFVPVMHYLCNRFGTRLTVGTIFVLSAVWKYGFLFLAATHNSQAIFTLDSSRNFYQQMSVQFPAQMGYFSAGILLLLYFDQLKNYFPQILVATVCLYLIDHFFTGELLDVFWITGLVFVFGFWRYFGNFSKHGDFSYGIYIVHWPILQVLITLGAARLNAGIFFLIAVSTIGICSMLMWFLIERRFLKKSSHYRHTATAGPAHALSGLAK